MKIIGLMTGTSAESLDSALVELTPEGHGLGLRLLGFREQPFEDRLRTDIIRLIGPDDVPLSLVSSVDARLGQFSAQVVQGLCRQESSSADLVVSHGQTVRHDVNDDRRITSTLQLGQPAWIAETTGIPVLSDVRSRDVAAGGQGAPLAGMLDQLLVAGASETTGLVNLGGIANLTVTGHCRRTVSYDTGPANALLDLMARRITGDPRAIDRDGELAGSGEVDQDLLIDLLDDPYYARPEPKSTGKEHFGPRLLQRMMDRHPQVQDRDVMATLTALTARTVADACRAHQVQRVIVSGGGSRNPALMAALGRELGAVPETTDVALGLPEAAKEATLMALIGWLSWHGLPGTLIETTGAQCATVAGRLTAGAEPLSLPRPLSDPPTHVSILR